MKRAGSNRPGSLLSWHADGFGVAPPPLSPKVGSHGRRSVALLPHARLRFNPFPEHGAMPPLSLRSLSECPDDKGLRHREACLSDGTRPVRGGLSSGTT